MTSKADEGAGLTLLPLRSDPRAELAVLLPPHPHPAFACGGRPSLQWVWVVVVVVVVIMKGGKSGSVRCTV